MATLVSVISSDYCLHGGINLKIDMKLGSAYIDNKVVFNIKKPSVSLHGRRILYDVSKNPVLTLRNKMITLHDRCQAFRGKSKDPTDLLFSVKRSKMIPGKKKIEFDVFLPDNTKERVCNYKVKATSLSCDIYVGESSDLLARMERKVALEVFVHPNVDYAFIVTLLMIVDDDMEHLSVGASDAITLAGIAAQIISS